MCIKDNFSGDCGASCSLVRFWQLGVRGREVLNPLFSFAFPWLPPTLSYSRSAPTQEIITCYLINCLVSIVLNRAEQFRLYKQKEVRNHFIILLSKGQSLLTVTNPDQYK